MFGLHGWHYCAFNIPPTRIYNTGTCSTAFWRWKCKFKRIIEYLLYENCHPFFRGMCNNRPWQNSGCVTMGNAKHKETAYVVFLDSAPTVVVLSQIEQAEWKRTELYMCRWRCCRLRNKKILDFYTCVSISKTKSVFHFRHRLEWICNYSNLVI